MRYLSHTMMSLTVLTVGCCIGLAANAETFNFNNENAGTGTPLTLTVDGLTAAFSSSGDPGGFQVQTPTWAGVSFTDNVLLQPGTTGQSNQALDITFSAPVTSFSGEFATIGQDHLDLSALAGGLNGTPVGSAEAVGVIPIGYSFPEGTISFSGASFDSVVLQDPNNAYFALSTFTVTQADPAPIPEPSSLALLGAALAGLGIPRFRRAL